MVLVLGRRLGSEHLVVLVLEPPLLCLSAALRSRPAWAHQEWAVLRPPQRLVLILATLVCLGSTHP